MSVFHHLSYKTILKEALHERMKAGRNINLAKLASACGIQNTYLSKVFNHHSHLSSDQLHLACKFLGLSGKEMKYVFLLHEAERSSLSDRRESLMGEAKKLQIKSLKTENFISAQPVRIHNDGELSWYYLNPVAQLVHMFLCIPKYAMDDRLISEDLNLGKEQLKRCLDNLVKFGFIVRENEKWKVLRESLHLPNTSEIYRPYRALLRTKALDKLVTDGDPDSYGFSLIFAADSTTRRRVQEKFLEFLNGIEPMVRKAQSHHVYQLNFDLLNWSRSE